MARHAGALTELQILKDANQRRRRHAQAILRELNQALEPYTPLPAPPPPKRTIPAPGYRETGLARFKATRVVSGNAGR